MGGYLKIFQFLKLINRPLLGDFFSFRTLFRNYLSGLTPGKYSRTNTSTIQRFTQSLQNFILFASTLFYSLYFQFQFSKSKCLLQFFCWMAAIKIYNDYSVNSWHFCFAVKFPSLKQYALPNMHYLKIQSDKNNLDWNWKQNRLINIVFLLHYTHFL